MLFAILTKWKWKSFAAVAAGNTILLGSRKLAFEHIKCTSTGTNAVYMEISKSKKYDVVVQINSKYSQLLQIC